MSELITKESPEVVEFINTMDKMLSSIERCMVSRRPLFGGEVYVTDGQLSNRLNVSRRTTQKWRNEGKVDYIKLDGKVLYEESALLRLLEKNYVKAYQ